MAQVYIHFLHFYAYLLQRNDKLLANVHYKKGLLVQPHSCYYLSKFIKKDINVVKYEKLVFYLLVGVLTCEEEI